MHRLRIVPPSPPSHRKTRNIPMNAASIMGLRQLQVNQRATVERVEATGELGRRIRDIGLVPGTVLEVIGRAPLKDPVALRIKGFTLTLRNQEADHIMVRTEEA